MFLGVGMMFLATAAYAVAQAGAAPTTDVLGAHLNGGRGCTGCHAPHSGAAGNGQNLHNASDSGDYALWGQDVGGLENTTLAFGDGGKYSEPLPMLTSGTPDAQDVLTCLSCHDGNIAKGAMMTGIVYETLPATYGTSNKIPTWLGNDGTTVGNYNNDHPVGPSATFGCGAPYNWDCTLSTKTSSSGAISAVVTPGPNMARFITNYGFFVSLASTSAGTPYVVCTTCHNQHSMNVVKVTNSTTIAAGTATSSGQTGLATGYYSTMFFIRAPYNPASGTAGSNQVAQFCRQCHGGEANESNNSSAITTF
jgi:hypothetical protein